MVRGEIIFTDGKKPEANYETSRKDESSTIYNTVYSEMIISPGIDRIDILNSDGSLFYMVEEEEGKTNVMGAENIAGERDNVDNYIITSVIHKIDQVLEYQK